MLAQLPQTQDIQLAEWTHAMSRSVLREMIAIVSQPGITSFAGGLPDHNLFPVTGYAEAMAHVLASDPKALQYGPPYTPLKKHIVQLMAQRGVDCSEEQVFLTTGAQQGLDVLTRLLLNPGGEIFLEEIVYSGVQQVIAPLRPHIFPISTDLTEGIDVQEIETQLAQGARPAFIYVIPDAHNPLGVSMSQARREKLVALAVEYNIPIIEDDPYGFLQYGAWDKASEAKAEATLKPIRSLNNSHVIYLGSFSKILAPALRLGWMIVPEALLSKLTVVKEACDLESSALTQRAVAAYLDTGALPAHLDKLRMEYGRRRDAMLTALYKYFPAEARWTEPKGGMFIWVELPADYDTGALLETAVSEEKVAFIPGHAFAIPGHDIRNCLRLNFSNSTVEQIEEGMQRLAKVINR